MICDSCKTDKLITDFINSANICYKCVYRQKLEKMTGKRTEKHVFCRTCDKEIINQKNLKKRQRTVFCSCECAEKGHKQQLNNHWTRTMCPGDTCKKGRGKQWNSNQK